MILFGICKWMAWVSVGSHLVVSPVIAVVGGFLITPVGIGVSTVQTACFLQKHPGQPVSDKQRNDWNDIMHNAGMK